MSYKQVSNRLRKAAERERAEWRIMTCRERQKLGGKGRSDLVYERMKRQRLYEERMEGIRRIQLWRHFNRPKLNIRKMERLCGEAL